MGAMQCPAQHDPIYLQRKQLKLCVCKIRQDNS